MKTIDQEVIKKEMRELLDKFPEESLILMHINTVDKDINMESRNLFSLDIVNILSQIITKLIIYKKRELISQGYTEDENIETTFNKMH